MDVQPADELARNAVAEELREFPIALERDERLVGSARERVRAGRVQRGTERLRSGEELSTQAAQLGEGRVGIGNDRRGDLDQALEELGFQLIGRLADDAREDRCRVEGRAVDEEELLLDAKCVGKLASEAVGHEARTPCTGRPAASHA